VTLTLTSGKRTCDTYFDTFLPFPEKFSSIKHIKQVACCKFDPNVKQIRGSKVCPAKTFWNQKERYNIAVNKLFVA
jgi:hypothetical protein